MFPIQIHSGLSFDSRQDVGEYVDTSFDLYYGFISERKCGPDYSVMLSGLTDEVYSNVLLHKKGDILHCLEKNRDLFKTWKRVPAVYISPASTYAEKQKTLPLQRIAEDAYMFLDVFAADIGAIPADIRIRQTEERDLYVRTFRTSYSDPDDVYGAADEGTVIGAGKYFDMEPPPGVGYFATIAYKVEEGEEKPVGNVMGVYTDKYVQVVGLGTHPHYRRQGIGSALLDDMTRRARAMGIPTLMLQTEAGSANEKMYEKKGFKTAFTGTYYSEENGKEI